MIKQFGFGSAILLSGLTIGHLSTSNTISNEVVPELTLPAVVTSIHDGDTLSVRFSIEGPVRMIDNWSPELKEKGGQEAKDNLIKNCPIGSKVLVKIPLYDSFSRSFTFGRVLGRVYKDGVDLSELQVSEGFSTKKKVK
jgi:endonuclease YncB( thermonuclease family)